MDIIRLRLTHNLTAALLRLRQLGEAAAPEDLPGAMHENSRLADEVDEFQACLNRESSFATREWLTERVKRLSTALVRLDTGEYGTCVECAERISPARLRTLPEVDTCVRCHNRIEHLAKGRTHLVAYSHHSPPGPLSDAAQAVSHGARAGS